MLPLAEGKEFDLPLPYPEYSYKFPPRPENRIEPVALDYAESQGYWAQVKMHGTCNGVDVSPPGYGGKTGKSLICMPRHGKDHPHKLWAPTDESSRIFKQIPGDGWTATVCELMHSKTPNIKDTNYIFDLLVDNGRYLVGTTFPERQEMLKRIFFPLANKVNGKVFETLSHYVIDGYTGDNPPIKHKGETWLAKVYTKGFRELFAKLGPEHEGLVLKNPNAKLEICSRPNSNSGWQIKCRKGTKSYDF
jgi:hypothetical protein